MCYVNMYTFTMSFPLSFTDVGIVSMELGFKLLMDTVSMEFSFELLVDVDPVTMKFSFELNGCGYCHYEVFPLSFVDVDTVTMEFSFELRGCGC